MMMMNMIVLSISQDILPRKGQEEGAKQDEVQTEEQTSKSHTPLPQYDQCSALEGALAAAKIVCACGEKSKKKIKKIKGHQYYKQVWPGSESN